MLKVDRQEVNQHKVNEYFKHLQSVESVSELAKHFGRRIDEVLRELEKYTVIKYNRSGDIKYIGHDFTETATGIKVKEKHEYPR